MHLRGRSGDTDTVSEYIRVRNASLDGREVDIPKEALPIMVASGWEQVSKKDADAAAKAQADEIREVDEEMTRAGLAAIPEHVRRESVAMQVNVANAAAAEAEPPAKSEGKGK
jgi:hypothetical protein